MTADQFIDAFYKRVLSDVSNPPVVFMRADVLTLLNAYSEYIQTGRMLYSFDPNLDRDGLDILTKDDFDRFLDTLPK